MILRDFFSTMVDASVKILVDLWDGEITWALVPEHPLYICRANTAPWFYVEHLGKRQLR